MPEPVLASINFHRSLSIIVGSSGRLYVQHCPTGRPVANTRHDITSVVDLAASYGISDSLALTDFCLNPETPEHLHPTLNNPFQYDFTVLGLYVSIRVYLLINPFRS